MLAYAKKQNRFAIFEWDEKKRGWHWHTSDYPLGWEKVKVANISVPSKKALVKLKSASKPKLVAPWPSINASPSSRTRGSKKKTASQLAFVAERRVSYF